MNPSTLLPLLLAAAAAQVSFASEVVPVEEVASVEVSHVSVEVEEELSESLQVVSEVDVEVESIQVDVMSASLMEEEEESLEETEDKATLLMQCGVKVMRAYRADSLAQTPAWFQTCEQELSLKECLFQAVEIPEQKAELLEVLRGLPMPDFTVCDAPAELKCLEDSIRAAALPEFASHCKDFFDMSCVGEAMSNRDEIQLFGREARKASIAALFSCALLE